VHVHVDEAGRDDAFGPVRDGHLRVAPGQRPVGAGVEHPSHAAGVAVDHQQAVAVVQRLALGIKAQQLRAVGLHGVNPRRRRRT
jgi:hypothetical protein